MGGFNTIIPKIVPAEVEIPLNKVKLPTPLESDYVTPSSVLASSIAKSGVFADQKIRNPMEIKGEGNIYDDNDGTYATVWTYTWTKGEVATWDLGANQERVLRVVHSTPFPALYNRIYVSEDDVNYTLVSEAEDGRKTDVYQGMFRYVKWTVENNSTEAGNMVKLYTLNVDPKSATYTIDDDINTFWKPSDNLNAWCRWDMGALKICGGCRIYWGAENRPSSYVIEVSENGSDWIEVYNSNGETPPEGWKEYSWNARYCRYIRYRNTHPTGENQQINEFDYYSRIVERVASEHGHGSGITPHLKGHGVRRGFTYQKKISKLIERNPQLKDLIDYLEFMLNE